MPLRQTIWCDCIVGSKNILKVFIKNKFSQTLVFVSHMSYSLHISFCLYSVKYNDIMFILVPCIVVSPQMIKGNIIVNIGM